MAIEVETKDCTQLSDAELAEMADICAEGPSRFEAGLLSKQAELWVLITLAREGGNGSAPGPKPGALLSYRPQAMKFGFSKRRPALP